MINDEIRKKLNEQDWGIIIPNLLIYTQYKLRNKTVSGSDTADDFVQEAYMRVYQGERKWDPQKNPDLIEYLKHSVIDSLISASIKSKHNKLSEIDLERDDYTDNVNALDNIIASEIYDSIQEKIRYDEDLQLLFTCIVDYNIVKPKDIAKELGWEISEVNNAKKRLKRLRD
jgi:DNA-directed RNA polymerase specialized sigma24 family protein